MTRRKILAILAATTVFGGSFAMAASLGGITSSKLGADDSAVSSCDTNGVTTSYTSSWDSTDKRYETTSVTVDGLADTCDGQSIKVTLADGSNVQLGEGSTTVPTGTGTSVAVSLTTAASTESVANVHVTIAS